MNGTVIESNESSLEDWSEVDSEGSPRDEVQEIHRRSEKENRWVVWGRTSVTAILLLAATAVTVTMYQMLRNEETKDFMRAVRILCFVLIAFVSQIENGLLQEREVFRAQTARLFQNVLNPSHLENLLSLTTFQYGQFSQSLAVASNEHQQDLYDGFVAFSDMIESWAEASNSKWPFVTLPHFEKHASHFRQQTKVEALAMLYEISAEDEQEWIPYVGARYEAIVNESLTFSPQYAPFFSPEYYTPYPYPRDDNPNPDMFTVVYASSPPTTNYGSWNFDARVDPRFPPILSTLKKLDALLFTQLREYSASFAELHANIHSENKDPTLEHPHSFVMFPVREKFNDPTARHVATVSTAIGWDGPMRKLLPVGVEGMHCVIRNRCIDLNLTEVFTYEINGPEAIYLGLGDRHEPEYDGMALHVDLSIGRTDEFELHGGHCIYEMDIYPSKTFENFYRSSAPGTTAIAIAITFAVVIFVFYGYDFLVGRRNNKLVHHAARSNEIVSSMIPSHLRDRLIVGGAEKTSNLLQTTDDKPIADLFLDTSVMFADFANFTAWSSVRQPTQVFTFLEHMYGAFDVIARRYKIFKVETVGDCYVAAAGIPHSRKDHAVVIARFASDILRQTKRVARSLEVSLGPETSHLTLRIGIHSGSVTAGILRGERARYQLFGDTMNTASRIETLGIAGKVQVSRETANLLVEGGKGHWVEPREHRINAKGKGELQTYWLKTHALRRESLGGNSISAGSEASGFNEDPEASLDRLIAWNASSLRDLLKQVVARRSATRGRKAAENKAAPRIELAPHGVSLLDEVKEVIAMPAFDQEVTTADIDAVQIPPEIDAQITSLLTAIAGTYHDNDFHNFEHASHVTMSVTKLLSRIVAPSSIMTENEEKQDAASLHDHTYGITSDPLTQFACVFSALIHDSDHPGVPNAQLVKEDMPIAKTFNGRSVAEQNSLVICWDLLMAKRYEGFRSMLCETQEELERFRELVINCVLATDIVDKELKKLRNGRWETAFAAQATGSCDQTSVRDVHRKATIVIEHLIQASDVAHTMQHWHVYRKWNERFFRECYSAYKAGRAEKDPSEGWYKGEIGFFDFYIIPLAKKLKDCGVFGKSSDEYLNYALANRSEWQVRGEEMLAEMKHAIDHDFWMESGEDTELSI